MSRWNLAWLIAVPMAVLLGTTLTVRSSYMERDKDYRLVKTIVDVLAEVDSKYVKELNDEDRKKLVEDMINGGLQKLDPYSEYFNAEQLKHFETQTDGNFGGVGIQVVVDPKTNQLTVLSPIVGTPAYEAGILVGDVIIKIDDETTEDMQLSDAVKRIQGQPDTMVSLTVVHEGTREMETFNLKRAQIKVESVMGFKRLENDPKEWEWFVADGIGYIRIGAFNEPTAPDLRKALDKIEAAGAKALVLDLRDNPGGLLSSAIAVCDMFLSEGRIVSTRPREGAGKTYDAKADDSVWESKEKRPMVVLVNHGSASASEIVSAALQDNHRAIVAGERSYGKGCVQKIIQLEKDPPTALKLTTDSYWRPSGKNIHKDRKLSKDSDDWGVRPDEGFEVLLKPEERARYAMYVRDRDIVRGKPGAKAPEEKKEAKKEVKPFRDLALEKAIEYLKTR